LGEGIPSGRVHSRVYFEPTRIRILRSVSIAAGSTSHPWWWSETNPNASEPQLPPVPQPKTYGGDNGNSGGSGLADAVKGVLNGASSALNWLAGLMER